MYGEVATARTLPRRLVRAFLLGDAPREVPFEDEAVREVAAETLR
ncbi:hypothetical protein [Pimelobacter sp. 30-1]|nr:hypothetical protein [Pimelobacter sp. 30-1]